MNLLFKRVEETARRNLAHLCFSFGAYELGSKIRFSKSRVFSNRKIYKDRLAAVNSKREFTREELTILGKQVGFDLNQPPDSNAETAWVNCGLQKWSVNNVKSFMRGDDFKKWLKSPKRKELIAKYLE